MRKSTIELPSLTEILRDNPGWLDEAVDTSEAGRIIGFPACTLNTWRSRGGGPAFIKVGDHSVRYQRRSLFRFLSERQRLNTSDPGQQP